MYAVTAGFENKVNSVCTSDAATSRSVISSPRRRGTRSVHWLIIDAYQPTSLANAARAGSEPASRGCGREPDRTIDGVTFWGSPWTPWFFDWAFKNGDKMASELDYVPMPDQVVSMIQSAKAYTLPPKVTAAMPPRTSGSGRRW